MNFFILSNDMSRLENKYLKIISTLFIAFSGIGLATRYLRKEKYYLFSNDLTVGIEHMLAGFGIPALIMIIVLLTQLSHIDFTKSTDLS